MLLTRGKSFCPSWAPGLERSVDVKIVSLSIKNFRSYASEETLIRFDPKLTVLVGENNSGKSSVISALRIALGLEPPTDGDHHWGGESGLLSLRLELTFNQDEAQFLYR